MTLLEEFPRAPLREGSIPVLETKRLTLRAPCLEDAKTVAMLADDRRIAENTARIPHPYKLSDAESFITAANANGGEVVFLIALRDGTIVGACGVTMLADQPELGYWLGVPYWGKGYATEALHALIDYAFTDLAHEALQAGARVTNPASRRVLEKCGFQWTGVGLYRIRAISSSAPIDRFRLERGIWSALKSLGPLEEGDVRLVPSPCLRGEGKGPLAPIATYARLAGNKFREDAMAYDLAQFIADCRASLTRDPGPAGREQVRVNLERLLKNDDFIRQYCGDDQPHGVKTLHEDPALGFLVLAHTYNKARLSPPHDHGASWAIYGQATKYTDMTEWAARGRRQRCQTRQVEAGEEISAQSRPGRHLPGRHHPLHRLSRFRALRAGDRHRSR